MKRHRQWDQIDFLRRDDADDDVSETDGSAAETESDDHDPGPDQDGQDESVDSDPSSSMKKATETESETESSADPDPDPGHDGQDQDQDQDRYEAGDVDAPETKYERRGKLKGKLRTTDTDEFLTAADLVAAFGWSRETIDATLETLRRDDEIFGSEKTGWKYDG